MANRVNNKMTNPQQRYLQTLRKPNSGWIAVKIINHLGDEVMKVFRVG